MLCSYVQDTLSTLGILQGTAMNGLNIAHIHQLIKRVNGLFAQFVSRNSKGICLSGSVSHSTLKI